VIHLAGENIASCRWTAARKAKILDSRRKGTRLLSTALADLRHPPKALISASAIGYYGDRGEEILEEQSGPGRGFLADVCKEWESATSAAAANGIRVVQLRIGIVLSSEGGALPRMVTPFKLGAGGTLGNGRQYVSWITLNDLCRAVNHVATTESLGGTRKRGFADACHQSCVHFGFGIRRLSSCSHSRTTICAPVGIG
jgi:uncharacterized protein (TIGR01777 family)